VTRLLRPRFFLLWFLGLIWCSVFNDGFQKNPSVAKTKVEAVLSVSRASAIVFLNVLIYFCACSISIPLAIFSYIGVELLTVTAFEAANPSRLKGPTKHIAYIITVIYLVSIGGFVANLEWFNQNLPKFFDTSLVSLNSTDVLTGRTPHVWEAYSSHNSTAAPIISLLQVGSTLAPQIINGILIYAGISTANTALYVASRTLYGLTRDLSSTSENIMVRIFAKLNTVSPTTRIPVWSLIVSCLAFSCWTPWIVKDYFSTTAKDVSNQ
jgi:amino acid transporter